MINNRTPKRFEPKRPNNVVLIILLGIMNAITPFSIDMYLPAFPEIARDLKTTVLKVSFSVSSYFLGYAIGQILYGPLLDRFGRKRPIYAGLSLYILASLGCMWSGTIESLLVFRFIQALGGCVASVAAMAMVRDFFSVKESTKVFSLLILILGLSPLLAPTIGSLIVTAWGWKWVFGLLTLITVAVIFATYFILPEGKKADPGISLHRNAVIRGFKDILIVPAFYIYGIAGAFSMTGLFVYVAGSPSIFMEYFHLGPKAYGGIFALLSVGFIGGSQLNHFLTSHYSNKQIFKVALLFQVLFTLLFFIGALNNAYGLWATIGLLFLSLLCIGICIPNATTVALAPFSKNAGSASALFGFLQIGLGAIASAGVGLFNIKGSLPTACVMAATSIISLGILLISLNRKEIANSVQTQ